jgi:glycosyltransferase involved in cell wall biosynthesis
MRDKKIFFECNALVSDHFSGVGHYVKGIAQAWDRYIARPEHTLLQHRTHTRYTTVLCASQNRLPRLEKFQLEHMQRKALRLPIRIINNLLPRGLLPPLDLRLGKGVYFFTNFARFPLLRSKSATVVYDISYEVVTQYADANNARYLSKIVRKAVKKSDLIITISNHTKKELAQFYRLDPDKIIVAYPGVDRSHFYRRSEREIEQARHKYDLPGNYVLFVGNIEPRKNITGLIDAYTGLPRHYSNSSPLLLVGANGWLSDGVFEKLKASKQSGYTIVRPNAYIDDEDMPAIYSGASMLVYPSHYEGFGMPPLEAMSCGIPVIVANNTSLPEVVGDAGMLVESTDVKGITKAMVELMSDKSLRRSMVEKGYVQSRKFSWDKSAQKIYNALLELT